MKTKFRNLINLIIVISLFLSLSIIPSANAGEANAQSYIVQGTDSHQVAELVERYGGTVTSELSVINGVTAILSDDALQQLRANPSISAITPNAGVILAGKKFKSENPSTDYPDVIGADVVWEQGVTGSDVTVAVVDTGIGLEKGIVYGINNKKRSRILAWVDFVDGRRFPRDPNGHGTHIAGIIANTDIGEDGEWNGVAPGVNLVGVRVLNEEGYGTYEQVIQGIQWVIENKDAYNIKVMNLSLVSPVQSPYWADPLNQAVTRAWAEGITVVVAAGNGGPGAMSIGVPGNNPYVITVGAFTDNYTPNDWGDDYITPFSAAGPTLDGFVKPDVVAPGAHIVSTMLQGSYLAKNHKANWITPKYFEIAGTSQAAAVVSGLVSLTLSQNPDLTPDQVKYRTMVTSYIWVDMETTEALYSMWQQGAGRVNAPGATFSDVTEAANAGMDIWADLDGDIHYQGYTIYDEVTGEFKLTGDYGAWAGGYGAWAGGYGAWAGGYGAWAGDYGAWAGDYGAWAGDYGAWAGGYGAWAGGYGAWAGGYGAWAGGYGAWAGGYGAWAGGYGAWAGGYGAWAGSEPWIGSIFADAAFVDQFVAGTSLNVMMNTSSVGNWIAEP
jgi:serine protease AprX